MKPKSSVNTIVFFVLFSPLDILFSKVLRNKQNNTTTESTLFMTKL